VASRHLCTRAARNGWAACAGPPGHLPLCPGCRLTRWHHVATYAERPPVVPAPASPGSSGQEEDGTESHAKGSQGVEEGSPSVSPLCRGARTGFAQVRGALWTRWALRPARPPLARRGAGEGSKYSISGLLASRRHGDPSRQPMARALCSLPPSGTRWRLADPSSDPWIDGQRVERAGRGLGVDLRQPGHTPR